MTTQTALRITALYSWHTERGAHMTPFAGWNMPVYYTSIIEEHIAVREHAGIFDVSHMCPIELRGAGTLSTLHYLCTNDVVHLAPARVQYNLLLNEEGGVIDDILLSKLSENQFLLVANAGNAGAVLEWLLAHRRGIVEIKNLQPEYSIISLQGPAAPQILEQTGSRQAITIKKHAVIEIEMEGGRLFLSRTGYTGSDGFEFVLPNTMAEKMWEKLLEFLANGKRVLPCGLGARDSLRTEAGLPLYGHEYSADRNPLGTPYTWAIKFDKGDFMGRGALLHFQKEAPPYVMVGFMSDSRQFPRSGQNVHLSKDLSTPSIGWVSSGVYSPILQKGVGMAFVKPPAPSIGEPIFVNVRNRPVHAIIARLPFINKA